LNSDATELDWITKCSKSQILFYDKNQSVRPSDLSPTKFEELAIKNFELKSQLRVGGGVDGEKYIKFIQDFFDLTKVSNNKFNNYDFKIYEDIGKMVSDIKEKNLKMDLCRMVSGYAWPWMSKKDPNKHDIEIDGVKLRWNSVNHNWVYSLNAINEVGCIHTVQGYDLNYTGVIIGPEISYDSIKREFKIHPEKYMDMNGKRGVDDIKELERYIINIYKTLLTRGIHGTYVYIVDKSLRNYFKNFLEN
ncbi:MAG: DNA/RNA helicase domain-containing protein, partial [Patescibacteria group bacterium]